MQLMGNLYPYDSLDTLNNLIKSIEKNKVSDLILVGDVFHDQKRLKECLKM